MYGFLICAKSDNQHRPVLILPAEIVPDTLKE
jgi:hypothetical protein